MFIRISNTMLLMKLSGTFDHVQRANSLAFGFAFWIDPDNLVASGSLRRFIYY